MVADAAGVPLTLRGVASSFAVTSLRAGEASTAGSRLEALAAAADTLVLLMPLADLVELAERLGRILGERPAALVAAASLPEQRIIRGPVRDIAERARQARIDGPATLLVGEAVASMPALPLEELAAVAEAG